MSKILISAVAALLVTGLATSAPVFAHDGHDHSTVRDTLNETKVRTEQAVNETRETIKSTREEVKEARSEAKELVKSHKEQIEQRRSELKQEVETTRAERKAELKDKRLELCQQRQDKINELISRSAKLGRERLAHIQKIETNVKDFYTREQLTSSEYEAAAALVDEKEALAVAAVEVTESQQFDCTKVDGEKPSGEIKSLHEAKRTALNDYRDSVKQLIQIVKAAVQAKVSQGGAS